MTSPAGLTAALGRRRACWHAGGCLAVLLGALYLLHRYWPVVESGAGRLAVADPGWLLTGAIFGRSDWPAHDLPMPGYALL
ncbi:TIGR00374 family protein, partial [Streptomyces sp. NPDC051129]